MKKLSVLAVIIFLLAPVSTPTAQALFKFERNSMAQQNQNTNFMSGNKAFQLTTRMAQIAARKAKSGLVPPKDKESILKPTVPVLCGGTIEVEPNYSAYTDSAVKILIVRLVNILINR